MARICILKNEDLLCTCCLFPLPDAVLSFVTPVTRRPGCLGFGLKI
jgi:hypothetical protein